MSSHFQLRVRLPKSQLDNLRINLPDLLAGERTFALFETGGPGSYGGQESRYDWMAAIGTRRSLALPAGNALQQLEEIHTTDPGWFFGYLGYDLKSETDGSNSPLPAHTSLPDLYFFEPNILLRCKGEELITESRDEQDLRNWLDDLLQKAESFSPAPSPVSHEVVLHPRTQREDYIRDAQALIEHIRAGDVYEINYCQEFYNDSDRLEPLHIYTRMREVSPQPFSAFLRLDDKYIMSASMERYLQKTGDRLMSQPIKGTIRRGSTPEEDKVLGEQLRNDPKERAENIMIVDLVRNDLSRICKPGTVHVEELCGIYPFATLQHMISTVSGRMAPGFNWTDAIRHSFPMGSMTGAPKIMAMELTDRYEKCRRGVYSGALGYITPEGDFDFNVVIRTLLYDNSAPYLSVHVGSAITYDALPEKEYDECLLKLEGWKRVLGA